MSATAGLVEVQVDVPPGDYGVLVHHDVNGDGRINTNFFGIPVEGIGFSRDARLSLGFPAFSSVRLTIAGDYFSADVSLLFEPRAASGLRGILNER